MPRKANNGKPPSLYVQSKVARDERKLKWPLLPVYIRTITQAADAAERDGLTEYATRIRKHLAELAKFRKAGDMNSALVEAMDLVSTWSCLRTDAAFARPVDAYKRSRRKPTGLVTDDQIRSAHATHPRQIDAAAVLGIDVRQLRDHYKRLGLEKRRLSDRRR
jgi:hypothetical protein